VKVLQQYQNIALITAFEPEARFIPAHILKINSGVGLVNAAAATQKLIDFHQLDLIINLGVAGAISSILKPGDIIIADKLEYLYSDHSRIQADNFEKIILAPIISRKVFQTVNHEDYKGDEFSGDENVSMNTVSKHIESDSNSPKFFLGKIASSNYFIDSNRKADVQTMTDALAVDMESCAIAQVSQANCIDYLIVRIISDSADQDSIYEEPLDIEKTNAYIKQVTDFVLSLFD
jgi:nucleoside phosphorylase